LQARPVPRWRNDPRINNPVPAPKGAVDGATAAAIAAEGELKATIRTFQGDNRSAVYRYYWWRDNYYVRYQSGDYEAVPSDYCH
jgi:hypothetical protein